MNAREWTATLMLALATALGTSTPANAQSPRSAPAPRLDSSGAWTALESVSAGARVTVDLVTGRSKKGRLVSVDRDGLSVSVGESRETFQRFEIRQVWLVQSHIGRKAKRGLAVGAVAGGLLGGLTTRSNRISWSAFLATGWAAIGAVIGAIDGLANRSDTLIYATSDERNGAG